MATQLVRGMGSFFKNCACARQNRCAHPYAIRYRDAAGRQREETGYATQQSALDRLTKVYEEKRTTPRAQADLKREIGKQRFRHYASTWLTWQRHYAPGSVRSVTQVLNGQILPVLESRRMNTFTATVVDDFIMSMEERSVGLAAQQNAFDTLKKILLDARRRGGITEDPFEGVIPPEYIPRKITIPTLDEIHALKAVSSDGLRLVIDLMSGCGLRNGEAYAAPSLDFIAPRGAPRDVAQIHGDTRRTAAVVARGRRPPTSGRRSGRFCAQRMCRARPVALVISHSSGPRCWKRDQTVANTMAAAMKPSRTYRGDPGSSSMPRNRMATRWKTYAVSDMEPTAMTGRARDWSRGRASVRARHAVTAMIATPVLPSIDRVVSLCGEAASSQAGVSPDGEPAMSDHHTLAPPAPMASAAPGKTCSASQEPP